MKDFINSAVIKNWLTTFFGIVAAIIQILYPVISAGRTPTKQEVINAILMVIGGIIVKQYNVTVVLISRKHQWYKPVILVNRH